MMLERDGGNRSERKLESMGSYNNNNMLYGCMKLSKNKLNKIY